jgi:hypothetical protein
MLRNWFISKPSHLAGNFTYHIGLDMVIDIFLVSSAEFLKPINNAAMSLTSIQKKTFSPQTWTCTLSHIQFGHRSTSGD